MNETVPRRIVCAAMLMDDGHIVTGVRHFSPDMRTTLKRMYGSGIKVFGVWIRKPYHLRVKDDGFIDTHGNFLDRKTAWKHAEANGQILRAVSCSGTLYSENLY